MYIRILGSCSCLSPQVLLQCVPASWLSIRVSLKRVIGDISGAGKSPHNAAGTLDGLALIPLSGLFWETMEIYRVRA